MFHELLNSIQHGRTLIQLLENLSHYGFQIKTKSKTEISDALLEELWEFYDESPERAVVSLETYYGFLFERDETQETVMCARDWNRVVAAAKDVLDDVDGDIDAAKEKLRKIFSFMPRLEIRQAIEQAQEELANAPKREPAEDEDLFF